MAGISRFDSIAATPEELAFKGPFSNGQRVNLMNAKLDRSGSFREGNEGRKFSSGASMFRGNSTSAGDMPPLSQCLMLDPISMGDKKYTRLGELRRVLGISYGATLEDYSFGATNLKPPPPVATEELQRFKASVLEASIKASGRSKRLDESLQKLNKYCEALNSKKQLRNEILMNERLGGSNSLKMGSLIHRNPSEVVNQRLEDRAKNNILNKRVRTSVTENRLDGQSSNFLRQSLVNGKDRDTLGDGGEHCDIVEEKTHRLPAGESWDSKMKRKRSMGTIFPRPIDGEGEMKRVTHLKRTNESGLQSSDAQGLRSGSSGSNRKLDVNSLPAGSNACAAANNELEKVSRDSSDTSNKERVVLIGNKFNVRDNNYIGGVYSLTKGKASRATRPLMASSISRSSGTLEAWERPSISKPHSVSVTSNHKRPLPSGSSSPPMAQWVGQRPQKISRTRRANVISPLLNCNEVQVSLEGCSPSDVGIRMTSTETSGSLAKVAVSGTQQDTMKHENVSSLVRFSESEDYGAGENGESKVKEKDLVISGVDEGDISNSHNMSSWVPKKNKIPAKEEIGDGLQRQGRSSRGSSISRTITSPMKEKLESRTYTKPLKRMKPASEKNGSKSGRPPLKKLSDRKAVARIGLPSTGNSPDFAGESDNDREELLAAANFASNASYLCCSSSFWKGLGSIFTPVRLEDMAYLKEQVKSLEDDSKCLSQMSGLASDNLDGLMHKEYLLSQCTLTGGERSILDKVDSNELSLMVDQDLNISYLCRQIDSERNIAPLYQRVLTALIVEDDKTDEEETVGERNASSLCKREDSSGLACFSQDVEHKSGMRTEFESESVLSPKARNHCALDKICCNGNAAIFNGTNIHDQVLDDLLQVHHGPSPPETECSPLSENGCCGILAVHTDSGSSSFNYQFEQMSLEDRLLLELHSVGLYPEAVPDLSDADSEAIFQDIVKVQKGLKQQVRKKGEYLMKFIQTVEEGREMEQRSLEQVAMDKHVEFAYKKMLATRGSSAARNGLPKVSKQVAMAFMKRTLARCRSFEETGRSCFMEPVLKDVLFAAPTCDSYAGSTAGSLPLSEDSQRESALSGLFASREQYGVCNDKTDSGPVDVFGNTNHPSDLDFARTGPILNRGKKKELLLDDVGGSASLRSAATVTNSLIGGVKGKRSERERGTAKVSRPSTSHSRGERKSKAKLKQKIAPPSSSGSGFYSKLTDANNLEHQLASVSSDVNANGTNRKDKVESISPGYNPKDLSKEIEEPIDFTKLNELDLANELGGNQDLGFWLNIDEDGLQDHDTMGLETPLDDLAELNMLL